MNDWKIDEYKFSNDILHKDVIITTISDKNIANYIVEACNNYELYKTRIEELEKALLITKSYIKTCFIDKEGQDIVLQIEELLSHSTK